MNRLNRWITPSFLGIFGLAAALLVGGCSTLDEKQRAWIFQPSDRNWGDTTEGMADLYIDYDAPNIKDPVRLHSLWLPSEQLSTNPKAPVLLYLHGARWAVGGSATRIRRMQELGFSVLAIDYRGFGKSTAGLPSEQTAYEDARAAWDWLSVNYPGRPKYIFGHSLGGAIAIDLASQVKDEKGVIVEGTFSSIADVVGTFKWGWLPVSLLITQRFESVDKVASIGSPLLLVHGSADALIKPDLGKKLYDAAAEPKRFVLVEGGSHHNTNSVGQMQYREAVGDFFGIKYRAPDSKLAGDNAQGI